MCKYMNLYIHSISRVLKQLLNGLPKYTCLPVAPECSKNPWILKPLYIVGFSCIHTCTPYVF